MKLRYLSVLATALIVAVVFLSACFSTSATEDGSITVRVLATRNFGNELTFDEMIEVSSGTSAMAALMEVAEVETQHGGGFVDAINGIRSGFTHTQSNQLDWFIYINGIQTNTGALDYQMQDGDIQHWDFHDWSFHQFIPAIISEFPEPLLNGYRGKVYTTTVVYQAGWQEDASQVVSELERLGIEQVTIVSNNELEDEVKESNNLILIGTPDFPLIHELNQVWTKLGFYARFQGSTIQVFDRKGELSSEYGEGTGIIQATRSPWNPKGIGVCENIVLIVSGSDTAGVKASIDTLVSHNDKLKYTWATVIDDGEIIRIPQ